MTREQVIKALECCKNMNCSKCPYLDEGDEPCKIYDDAIVLLKAAGTWISAKDAPPETDHEIDDGLMSSKPVLVYGCAPHGKDRVIGVAWYLRDPNDKDWNEWDGVMMNMEEAIYWDITHWASIPELPKEEDDEHL